MILLFFNPIFSVKTSTAQSNFQLKLGNVNEENGIFDLMEYPLNNSYYCCGNIFTENFADGEGLLIRLSNHGDTLIRTIRVNGNNPALKKIFLDKDNEIMVIGEVLNNNTQRYDQLILCIDTLCEVKWQKIVPHPLPYYASSFYSFLEKKDGGFYVSGSVYESNNAFRGFFIMEYDLNYDTVRTMYKYYDVDHPTPCSLTYNSDSTRLWLFGHGFLHVNSVSQRIELDSNLTILRVQDLLPHCSHYQYTRWISDSTLFIAANHIAPGPAPREEDIALNIVDTALNMVMQAFMGGADTLNYLGISKGMDFLTKDSIFVLCDDLILSFWPDEYNYLHIGLYNSSLQCRYLRYLGGDAYYTPTSILATSDGGCLIVAWRYDYKINGNEHDIQFWKLNDEGLITGGKNNSNLRALKAILFPNPVTDNLYVETHEMGSTLFIYNQNGVLVKSKRLDQIATTIPLQHCMTGTYVYKIVYRNGSFETGKFIKQ